MKGRWENVGLQKLLQWLVRGLQYKIPAFPDDTEPYVVTVCYVQRSASRLLALALVTQAGSDDCLWASGSTDSEW